MIGQSRKGLASFHASVSFWCLSSLKIGRKNGAVSLILVSFVLNYKCSDFLCQSAFIYKISRERSVGTITTTENVPPPLRGVQLRLRLYFFDLTSYNPPPPAQILPCEVLIFKSQTNRKPKHLYRHPLRPSSDGVLAVKGIISRPAMPVF